MEVGQTVMVKDIVRFGDVVKIIGETIHVKLGKKVRIYHKSMLHQPGVDQSFFPKIIPPPENCPINFQ